MPNFTIISLKQTTFHGGGLRHSIRDVKSQSSETVTFILASEYPLRKAVLENIESSDEQYRYI